MKEIFQIEYVLGKISPVVLWEALSTTDGLSHWFADKVEIEENRYTFHWGKSEQSARLLSHRMGSFIRFHWEDDEPRYYFELKVFTTEISDDTILRITDFAESPTDMQELTEWWNIKVNDFKKAFGL